MKKYHRQKVKIVIDKESELYARLEEYADREGMSVREMIDVVLTLGAHGLLEKRLGVGR